MGDEIEIFIIIIIVIASSLYYCSVDMASEIGMECEGAEQFSSGGCCCCVGVPFLIQK